MVLAPAALARLAVLAAFVAIALAEENIDASVIAKRWAAERAARDDAPPAGAVHSQEREPSPMEVLQFEITKLKQENAKLQEDKQELLKTVRSFMLNNQTRVLQQQVTDMARLKASVEVRCAQEQESLRAEANQAGELLRAETLKANETTVAARSTIQAMRDDIKMLTTQLWAAQAALQESKKKADALAADKQHVVEAMQGVLKQNTDYAREVKSYSDARRKRKEVEETAVKKLRALRGHERHGHQKRKHVAAGGRRLRHKPVASGEDPVAYMGDESAITDFIARKHPAKASPAAADLNQWLENGPLPEGEGVGPAVDALSDHAPKPLSLEDQEELVSNMLD